MTNTSEDHEMRPEYDFSGGVRGKHHQAYQKGTNVVLLDRDVANVFKDSESVNHALRMLIKIAENEINRSAEKETSEHP
jgi:hypothetical protein